MQVLNGATVFSKLDLRWGCRQLELHPDSCGLTASFTTQGLKQYMRLIFGLSSASVMYQFVIQQVLNKIPGSTTHLMTLLSLAKSFANMPQLGSDTATPACQCRGGAKLSWSGQLPRSVYPLGQLTRIRAK